jgi:probable F420-dependent oxidoreductase
VKFGVRFANGGRGADPEYAVAVARLTEEAGFESIWAGGHLIRSVESGGPYPYSADGTPKFPSDFPYPEVVVWLSYVAAVTERLRLATNILILPAYPPVLIAKQLATLDRLSGGRVELGIGVGWLPEELEAVGVPFGERGARTDESIAVLRTLWSEPVAEFSGRFTSFPPVSINPRPVQDRIPIVVGGHTRAAARRAGRLGDGFLPAGSADLDDLLVVMRDAAVEAGRLPDEIAVTLMVPGVRDLDQLAEWEAMGVTRLIIPRGDLELPEFESMVKRFADEVIGPAGG